MQGLGPFAVSPNSGSGHWSFEQVREIPEAKERDATTRAVTFLLKFKLFCTHTLIFLPLNEQCSLDKVMSHLLCFFFIH